MADQHGQSTRPTHGFRTPRGASQSAIRQAFSKHSACSKHAASIQLRAFSEHSASIQQALSKHSAASIQRAFSGKHSVSIQQRRSASRTLKTDPDQQRSIKTIVCNALSVTAIQSKRRLLIDTDAVCQTTQRKPGRHTNYKLYHNN